AVKCNWSAVKPCVVINQVCECPDSGGRGASSPRSLLFVVLFDELQILLGFMMTGRIQPGAFSGGMLHRSQSHVRLRQSGVGQGIAAVPFYRTLEAGNAAFDSFPIFSIRE